MMHLGLIGAVVGVLFVLWLIPTLVGGLFSGLWWLVKLPFRLVWLLVVEGVGGLLALLWRLFTGFFGLFGWVGTIVQWLVVIAAVVFGGMVYKIGQKVRFSFSGDNIMLFSRVNGKRIANGSFDL